MCWQGAPATSLSVRAGKDRICTVVDTATENTCNTIAKTATITVAHDQSGQ